MDNDVFFEKIDNVSFRIKAKDKAVHTLIINRFSFKASNAKYDPRFKRGLWDGYIRIYNNVSHSLYLGLLPEAKFLLEFEGYNVISDVDFNINNDISKEFIISFCNKLKLQSKGTDITPRKYQYLSLYLFSKYKRCTLVSATGSGKSLSFYLMVRYFLEYEVRISSHEKGKILFVVPDKQLVSQLYSDFEDYSTNDEDFIVSDNVHKIFGGQEKDSKQRVYISTYHSLAKQPDEYFEQFSCVMIDEVHRAKAKSFVEILKKCTNANYRIGMTGSMDGVKVNEKMISGLLGKINIISETNELVKTGELCDFNIKVIMLNHRQNDSARLNTLNEIIKAKNMSNESSQISLKQYQNEVEFISSMDNRNEFIRDFTLGLDGNSLILFNLIDKQGMKLFKSYEDIETNKNIHFLHGGIKKMSDREDVIKTMEKSNNNILLASYKLFSTGKNIKNLKYIVLHSSVKSMVTVIQSIGRGLRLHNDINMCTVYDICDKLDNNFTFRHGMERIKIYKQANYNYTIEERYLND
jgi:superfamily II DNA or RNA helicase